METYNKIGEGYNKTRKADPRIVAKIVAAITDPENNAKSILEVGAGTGNYTHAIASFGFHVTALEPAQKMMDQAVFHANVTWKKGNAETLDFESATFDHVICLLALHHFADPEKYLDQAYRNGISVFSLFDQHEVDKMLSSLRHDLHTGKWEATYGHIRKLEAYEGGYYFIEVKKKGTH